MKTESSGSIGFLGLLGLLFIGLKLGGVITWEWWLVLLPLYGPLVLLFLVLGCVSLGLLAVHLATKK